MAETKLQIQQAIGSYINPPQGYMVNGKLTVTDSGSGLVVALKNLAGNDPTAADPVIIRIGNTVRTVTAATSVTLADGTNWFNAGSSELATKEIDYFVYAVYDSNSSVVALGFARIPYGALVSDFSNTTTNEKYIAGYSGFTTTDEVEVIGRFAATLSASAAYTWSVPTYTAANLIQRPIYETRWLNYVPAYTGFSSAPTGGAVKYRVVMNTVYVNHSPNGNGTSNATSHALTAPFTAINTANYYFISAWGSAANNGTNLTAGGRVYITPGSATFTANTDFAAGAWTNANGKIVNFVTFYEI